MARTTAGPSDFKAPQDVKAAGFQICAADESGSIVKGHDVKRKRSHRGVEGTAHKFSTSVTNGTSTFIGSLKERIEIYVSWFAVYAAAFVAMVGKVCPKFASDLILLVARILILVFVTPEIVMHVSDLYAKENEIGVQATSNGGLLNTGCSLDTNESSLTGGSKSVHVSDGSPLLLSEREARDRIMQDASHRGVEGTADKFSTLVINFISTFMGLPKERVRIYLSWFALCATTFVAMVEKVCPKFANDVTLFVGFILYLVFVIPKIRMHTEENNVGVQVTRNDDGLLNTGSSLDTNKSSLTGESKSVHVSDGSPLLLSEREVQDGIMQDASEHSWSESRRLLIACPSDDLIRQLVHDLNFGCLDKQKQAASKIRLLTKNKSENRIRIARHDVIEPLIALILSPDSRAQQDSVTAILNLSICDENKEMIVASGAIEPLVRALSMGTPTVKENAACTLLQLSKIAKNKVKIGRSGAIPPLVSLLKSGGSQGKKDASTALYSLCSENENKVRAVQAGAMRPLVEQMVDLAVERAAMVVSKLVGAAEARVALVEVGEIPVLVELVDTGTQRQKDFAAGVLLQLCEDGVEYRTKVGLAGATPPLMALAQSGANPENKKAKRLLKLLGQSRSGDAAARTSMPSA